MINNIDEESDLTNVFVTILVLDFIVQMLIDAVVFVIWIGQVSHHIFVTDIAVCGVRTSCKLKTKQNFMFVVIHVR